ncbi:MAG: cell surface protein SprA [Gracilimonas sp.]
MHSFLKLVYYLPFALLVNGLMLVCISAQDTTDTTKTVSEADSTLDGVKFIYRPPKSPVSIQERVKPGGLYYISSSKERYVTSWDSVDTYQVKRVIDGIDVAIPQVLTFNEYAKAKKKQQIQQLKLQLIKEGMKEVRQGRGLLDFSLQIPGGQSSVFTTIFGKPEVNLRVNGSANMNVGVSIQNIDDPTIDENLRRRIDPTFNQNLQLNIQGTIGDKLTIATDWDTERAFDFQNRLSIRYEGYEDEIIKQIEMGNVSMETGNSLISGGASLFGIKSVAELGSLKLTSVVSQQKGESNTQTISGGSQETQFSIRPSEYQNNRHFFIDFYNRQEFEENVSDPQQLIQAYQISDMKVWISEPQVNTTEAEAIRAAAFADLGVVENNGTYFLPNTEQDTIDDALLEEHRSNTSASAGDFNVSGNDFYNGYFRPLLEGADYTINRALGYISLNRGLSSGAYLAISFVREAVPGEGVNAVQVGDISPRNTELTYLKLIRQNNPTPDLRTWPLTMRNVYSLGVSDLRQDGLVVEIKYTGGNVDATSLPELSSPLLQDLGLDRTDTEGAVNPDNQIDFSSIVLDPRSGNILFPYLEPFGNRIIALLEQTAASDSVIEALSYTELYTETQNTAAQSSKKTLYRIEGVSKGGVSGNFTLGFSLVDGSVKVFANGSELTEGTDYEVDYSFGSITILNDRYLAAGQDIEIEYENNQLNVIGQKNFTGLRAEYELSDDISIGGTYFKLKEQPLSDKIRIGNESINNTILGMDANARFDTPWMTRFIDRIPLLQTKEPSNINLSGEFAQLRPDVAQTNAVRRAIDNGELFSDEENGLAFIDDFEGSELSISFISATRWNLAAAPAAIPGYGPDEQHFEPDSEFSPNNSRESKIERSDLRSKFSWYTIPRNITSILGGAEVTPESQTILTEDVFPGRETNNAQDEVINTLDIHYDPSIRGPYNYNMDLKNKLENEPENQWGGMTAVLPSGQEDLTQNNIEFIEFWVQPILPGGKSPDAGDIESYSGKIYIDIGTISEDVVPNFTLNTEDGLARNPDNLVEDRFPPETRSYVMQNPSAPQGQFSNENRELEDVGFDGVPSANGYDDEKVETVLFSNFIEEMRDQYGEESSEYQSILADPSNDDYIYYGESQIQHLPLQERFYRVMGYHEGNTPVAGGEKRAITPRPDTEGLVSRSNVETNNNYYQYEVNLNPADFSNLEIDIDGTNGTYIVDKVPGERQQDRWHLVRIPLSQFERKIGEIEGFQNISHIRVWMSGYEKPFTLRFASFEFIGSQWRKVDNIDETVNASGDFKVSTINIEENANRQPVPYRQPEGSIRALNRGVQVQTLANEQSIVLGVEDLGAGEIQMVKRVFTGDLNLLNYENMRMFVHGEGYRDNNKENYGRNNAELVIRMGTDLNSNYYEYRQPVTPSDPDYPYSAYSTDGGGDLISDAEQVWLYDENSMNVVLGVFNELKQLRDQQGLTDFTQRFELELNPEDNDAVEGAVVSIKGNPSLDRIAEIGMGVRNPFNPSDPDSPGSATPLNAEFWLNELRVSGFDNEKGWKATAKAGFKFADFATFNSNFSRTTTGFGSLNSRLGNRSVSDDIGYDLSSTVNLHKIIPDRFGWNFPVTVSTRKNISTPKFLPDQGDIRLDDFINATNNNDELSEAEKEAVIDERINEIETVRDNFSINVSNISKKNSKSKLAQYTIDNTRLSYVYNEGSEKNPQYQFRENWNYNTSIQYNLSFNNVKLLRPFAFTEDIPVAKVLSGLRLGYMPSSITTSANLNRSYNDNRRRPILDEDGLEVIQPLQQSHNFNQRSSFGFNYNLTPSIPFQFRTNTNYDLSSAGIREGNVTGLEADSSSYTVIPTFEVLGGLVNDTLKARRSTYEETYTASWRPKLNKFNALNWLTYSASYNGGYGWTNSARGSNRGARVSNSFRLSHTLKFDVGDLIERVDFFDTMAKTNDQETNARKKSKNDEEAEPAGPDLIKDVQYLGRKAILAIFSIQNIDLSYNQNKSSNQDGYSGESQIYYAFNDPGSNHYSPPFGYRFGFAEEIPISQLIQESPGDRITQLPKNNNFSDDLAMSTKLNLFNNFSVDLSWSTKWDERITDNISLSPLGEFSSTVSSSGNISSSVWAFGPGYRDLFDRQLQTAFDDLDGTDVISDETGNGDGRIVLNRNTLEEDFRKAYLGGGTGAVGEKGYTPIPKPNWRVTWSGVQNFIPFIGNSMRAATLSHRYEGSYRLGWNLNTITGLQSPQGLGVFNVIDNKGNYEPTSINVDQRFSPLVQLNVTWESDLRTQIGYDRSKTTSLALSSRTISERVSKGLTMSINYTFKKVTIPFFPKIKNNIDVTINGGLADDLEEKFYLSQDINKVFNSLDLIPEVNQYDIDSPDVNGQYRLNASLVLGYRFSQTVTSNFEYTFRKIEPKTSGIPPSTNHDIRFNFRIAIQSR